ncbi:MULTISPECIES: DUF6196 family protein [unclassified Pseudomonas]|uniref:DUF6196 family protein n=1 Tax=unclassified Pseudomonas TaxID=196821 RepID=UPI001F12C4ED|nr:MULTISPECIES: DUF6196 family protein [unclassified Pseudomonas]UMY63766.1 DUF6196 family protein [Pseudomonas sp. LS.1a]
MKIFVLSIASVNKKEALRALLNGESEMVNISHETVQDTERRLLHVITQAHLRLFPGTYAFLEFPLSSFPDAARPDALALVRDDQVWSQLVPCADVEQELFGVCRFHFPQGSDNSGFVGWLAMRLKQKFGTGVFVTCGQNRDEGGIFDYWGVPASLASDIFAEIQALVDGQADGEVAVSL